MSRTILAVGLLAALAGPAAACLNDSELAGHEREFRSQYRGPADPPAASPAPEPVGPVAGGWAAGVGGVLLLAVATRLAWRGAAGRG